MTDTRIKNAVGVPFLGSTRTSTDQYKKNYNSIFRAVCVICGEDDRKSKMDEFEKDGESYWFHPECEKTDA